MKTAKKVWLIVAGGLVLLGLILFVCALAYTGFDVQNLSTVLLQEKITVIDEPFQNIRIEETESDVEFVLSNDNTCKVSYMEGEGVSRMVYVQDGTLIVRREDDQKWLVRIGVWTQKMKTTVYLPKNAYESLYVRSVSGNIFVPSSFSFTLATIENTSGNIQSAASMETEMFARTVSGNISIEQASPQTLTAITTSGNLSLSSMTVRDAATMKTVSGDVNLKQTRVENELSCSSTSGNVTFEQSDAGSLRVETVSGDVSGTLLSQKMFQVQSTSGNTNVPLSQSGGICTVTTMSGNVHLSVMPE